MQSTNDEVKVHIDGINNENPIELGMNQMKSITATELEHVYSDQRYFVYKISISSSNELTINFRNRSPETNSLPVFFLNNWYSVENWNGIKLVGSPTMQQR